VVASDYSQDLRIGPEILKQIGDLYRRLRNTLRYLLGALDGIKVEEHLPYEEMPELERWVLHRLYEFDVMVREDIEKYDFNHLLTELHTFCSVDLSAFYFDVRKDSLYCDRPDDKRRRAARTVMDHLLTYLNLWLAPILCFTAEEAWLARSANAGESIHLQTFLSAPKIWQNDQLANKWDTIRLIRGVVTTVMEAKRNDKVIGSSLQAHPIVFLKQEAIDSAFADVNASEVFITSGATLVPCEDHGSHPVQIAGGWNVRVDVGPAKGMKCERCWQVLPEVGEHKDHPDLCHRCHDAVLHLRRAAA
jgi:isoleucyl-tRNA synthetase